MTYTGGTCPRCGAYFTHDAARALLDHTMRDCLRILALRRAHAVAAVVRELDELDAAEARVHYQLRLEEAEARV